MSSIGILAYGSLINDPGTKVSPLIVRRIATLTPFPVEYARLSGKRGGAPTLVPHLSGSPVKAEVFLLSPSLSLEEAKSLLWRRETRIEGSGRTYKESPLPDAVVIRDEPGFLGLEHVLFTDFNPLGKISRPDPRALAEAAIASVGKAPPGKDGISYLVDLIKAGVVTPLTAQYQKEVLILTGTYNLAKALDSVRARTH